MQPKNWDDVRYLLAVARGQTLGAAARQLGVDDTTVSRRIARLQVALGATLVKRAADGALLLTPAGEAVAQRAEVMEHHFGSISETVGLGRDACSGTVRLTSVPMLTNRVLAPGIGPLLRRHPHLVVELIPDSRDFSLTRREADLAIRLARPTLGGRQVKAQRIATLDYAVYAAAALAPRQAARLPWVTFDAAMAHLPQAQSIAKAEKSDGVAISGLRVRDAETALEATLRGLGKTLLPRLVGDRDSRLRRLKWPIAGPRREIWLLAHADQVDVPRIAAVAAWVRDVFRVPRTGQLP